MMSHTHNNLLVLRFIWTGVLILFTLFVQSVCKTRILLLYWPRARNHHYIRSVHVSAGTRVPLI